MNLKEIIKAANWESVSRVFLHNYPDQKKSIPGYEVVFNKLKSKRPSLSSMELICDLVEPTFKGDEPYHDVYGIDGTKREDGEMERYSLSLTPWSKWLGASLSESTLNKYTKEEIISHCLFDMTFHGFSELEMKKVRKEIDESVNDHKDPIRYVIVSILSLELEWKLFFNISDETWCDEIDSATIFKREKHALAILKTLNKGRDKSRILAKITTKNKKRKVLKYYK
jgi:hypothetical protein